jgi:imidazolonepropionase-like amidohydrolase
VRLPLVDQPDFPDTATFETDEAGEIAMLTLTNARLFDGQDMLPGPQSVTLDGNRIVALGKQQAISGETIDLGGMTLMPGLITSHLHADFYKYDLASGAPPGIERPPGVMMAIGVRTCRVLLESGFTGYVGAACSNDIDAQLKMAIAEDIIPGPRIRACSHHIGTTGDLNNRWPWWRQMGAVGVDRSADGDGLLALVRDEIRRGAETIKIFAGSGHGVPSNTVRNMSSKEIGIVVEAAHERGARVRAHVYDKATILDCLALGVDVIDHGDEVDEECIELMAKAGTFWVPSQIYLQCLIDIGYGDAAGVSPAQMEAVRRTLPLAHKAGVRILIGDDYSGIFRDAIKDDPLDHVVGNYGREFAHYGAIDGLSPADVLSWGTKNAGELLVDQPARVGVIEPGALADLIVVDGDPTADLTLLARPEQALKAVIRDGAVVIDRLPPRKDRLAA